MSTYPKNQILLYRNELISYYEMAIARRYGEKYVNDLLDIWRKAAHRSSGGHYEAYQQALWEIDKRRASVQ